jgi:hypothetical protein
MRLYRALVCGLGVLLLPLAAARADDASYCAALGDLAWRYIAAGAIDGASKPDLEAKAAIADCDKGNLAAGIAVLERKLRDNGITLPKRSTARAL